MTQDPHDSTQVTPPFEVRHLIVDGCIVPHVEITPIASGPEEGKMNLVVHHRFCVLCTEEELGRWAYVLANAMAVSAGYTCHGPHSKTLNPHSIKTSHVPPGEMP